MSRFAGKAISNVRISHRRRTVSFSGNVSRRNEDDVEILEPEAALQEALHVAAFQAQRQRKNSGYSFTSDLPDGALKVRALFQRLGRAVWNHSDTVWAKTISWIILALLLWAILYSIEGEGMGPEGDLFRLLVGRSQNELNRFMVMIIVAYLMGQVTELCKLPGLLGMLVTGLVLRNIKFYHPAVGKYADLTKVMKQLATTCGMIRAGMRLVPDAIYAALHCHHGLVLSGLGFLPSFLEAMVTAVISYFILDYSIIWALCLGFLLCPNSPSAITPPMAQLMAQGYGEEEGIGVLVHGAAGLDVAFSVTIFDLCLAILFHGRHLEPWLMIGKGSLDVLADIVGGFVLGVIAGLLPVQDNALALWKRTFATMTGGMLAIVLGPRVGLPGTGPLSSIVTGFVASMLWKLQAPLSTKKTVNDIIQAMWIVLCPMLFAFTGSDVDISYLDWYTVCWMVGIVLVTVVVRLLGCILVLCGGGFSFKEMLFVGLIFQGKATNQAALAPQILYAAWATHDDNEVRKANEAVTMGVLSILICTPLAHLGALWGGPCLLKKKTESSTASRTKTKTDSNHTFKSADEDTNNVQNNVMNV
ncbi:sodium/hydrogen exchanger 9B1-like isoform X2 [Macrosteles quadrilineatus]|uniref:sodium/hydrogen exchanger 9B1-like isoform X2 n=1 Tax=Macrosteles quadrilineatus TaxID=74068 RepID=UPI0023E1C26F|nr:sodium/hydrogen exchanger 9B1-like isoform X2 [Macrosteles quadrilineatus]